MFKILKKKTQKERHLSLGELKKAIEEAGLAIDWIRYQRYGKHKATYIGFKDQYIRHITFVEGVKDMVVNAFCEGFVKKNIKFISYEKLVIDLKKVNQQNK